MTNLPEANWLTSLLCQSQADYGYESVRLDLLAESIDSGAKINVTSLMSQERLKSYCDSHDCGLIGVDCSAKL